MNAASAAKEKYEAAGCEALKATMDKVKLSTFGRLKAVGTLGFGAFKKGVSVGNVAAAQVAKAQKQVVNAHKAAAAATNASAKFAQRVQANANTAAKAAQKRANNAKTAAEQKAANAAKAAAEAQALLAGQAVKAAQGAATTVAATAAPIATVSANIPKPVTVTPTAGAQNDNPGAPATRRSRRSSRRNRH
jgi:colicin import membrane protein